ncbi:hypothetical protein B0H17DRAFT_1139417 [Mycena rosella]|uniref:Uncharacterized protein n=1 Tax=Mycena rosella TaxID=1033263 RepID=A0AAD7D429_MYCRO|nr:hypothetical protein B0H17DRAFT_1139417 [Mycena rosella]
MFPHLLGPALGASAEVLSSNAFLPVYFSLDIRDAKAKYIEKQDHFIGLSISFKDRVPEWQLMPRKTQKVGKEVIMPSQRAIYQIMLAEDTNFSSTMVPINKIAKFLDHGLKTRNTAAHELQSYKKEIMTRTAKLRDQISDFRQDQKDFMRNVGDKVAAEAVAAPAIEDERLYLPPDLTEPERKQMDLVDLGREEARWREGQAFDALRSLQNVVKALIHQIRHVGDSKRTDGLLWRSKVLPAVGSQGEEDEDIDMQDSEAVVDAEHDSQMTAITGTQIDKHRSGEPQPMLDVQTT